MDFQRAYVWFACAVILLSNASIYAKSPAIIFAKDTVIPGSLEIPDSVTAIMHAGVTFRFAGYGKCLVRGALIAEGTQEKPVTFTCVGRVRGATTEPCWYGIIIAGSKAFANLRHCRIEGAYRNVVAENNAVFDSCEFVGNHCGLFCTKKASPHVKYCRFYRNAYGIVADFANPLLLENVITENTIGIYLQTDARLVAGKNVVYGNQTNIKAESCLKGDTTSSSVRDLWELMRQLY